MGEKNMRALIVDKPGKFKLIEKKSPKAADGKAVIKVTYASICGSDGIYWSGDLMLGRSLGHEFSGIIEDPGDSEFAAGEKVCAMEINPCGKCLACRSGRSNICPSLMKDAPGISADGGFAEYVAVRHDMIRRVPEGVSMKEAAMAEPLAVACHGVHRAGVRKGDKVLIWGDGPIGIFSAACAKAAGTAYVGLVGNNPTRLKEANDKSYIDEVFNIDDAACSDALRKAEPEKFSLIIECTGRIPAIKAALGILRNGGRITMLGIHDNIQEINTLKLLLKEQDIITSAFFTPEEYDEALGMMASGVVDIDDCATSVRGLCEAQTAFEELRDGVSKDIKILLDPTL